jgi:hypothetical protein
MTACHPATAMMRSFRRRLAGVVGPVLLLAAGFAPVAAGQGSTSTTIVDGAVIHWNRDVPLAEDPRGFVLQYAGQVVEQTAALGETPPRARITGELRVEPIVSPREDGVPVPNDPWNRLGSVTVLTPSPSGGPPVELELIRFITGYGGATTFRQDLTSLAPLLQGTRTFRVFVSSYSPEPGWRVWFRLHFDDGLAGYRKPALAVPVFQERHVIADSARGSGLLTASIRIPPGLARPRLRLITTGHSTDGAAGNEFLTCPHVLRVDGSTVAIWRPWSEGSSDLDEANPWAGWVMIDGERAFRTSHVDRSGWKPGRAVEPLMIPLPELTPDRHTIQLEITGIRPAGADKAHGYWVVSGVVVADEPWPPPDPP